MKAAAEYEVVVVVYGILLPYILNSGYMFTYDCDANASAIQYKTVDECMELPFLLSPFSFELLTSSPSSCQLGLLPL
jgi:hypothetical protein